MNNQGNTLHTLNCSTREHAAVLERLLRCASTGDSLLLIENGVYNLTDIAAQRLIADAGLTLYCLKNDVLARGLQHSSASVKTVDDAGFVELSCTHAKVVSWFV
jgi:sulfur relay protein TusB/DsrH